MSTSGLGTSFPSRYLGHTPECICPVLGLPRPHKPLFSWGSTPRTPGRDECLRVQDGPSREGAMSTDWRLGPEEGWPVSSPHFRSQSMCKHVGPLRLSGCHRGCPAHTGVGPPTVLPALGLEACTRLAAVTCATLFPGPRPHNHRVPQAAHGLGRGPDGERGGPGGALLGRRGEPGGAGKRGLHAGRLPGQKRESWHQAGMEVGLP